MKISRHKDGSKAIELAVTESEDSKLSLQGDTTVTANDRETGEASTVATISQHGAMNFNQRPTVAGQDVALASDSAVDLSTNSKTIVDNYTDVIALCPVQEMVTVLYSIQNESANEKGVITIIETDFGYSLSSEKRALEGYFANIEFGVRESNGSLLLDVIGSGAGLITDFKYRVNTVNTLYV